jgi:hypothetical protein
VRVAKLDSVQKTSNQTSTRQSLSNYVKTGAHTLDQALILYAEAVSVS